jgi:hypothetical protein
MTCGGLYRNLFHGFIDGLLCDLMEGDTVDTLRPSGLCDLFGYVMGDRLSLPVRVGRYEDPFCLAGLVLQFPDVSRVLQFPDVSRRLCGSAPEGPVRASSRAGSGNAGGFPRPSARPRPEAVCEDGEEHGRDARVAVRHVRRDAMEELKKQKAGGHIPEDDEKHGERELQKDAKAEEAFRQAFQHNLKGARFLPDSAFAYFTFLQGARKNKEGRKY